MRLLVTGDRYWKDRGTIRRVLETYLQCANAAGERLIIIHGAQGYYDKEGKLVSGADMMADEECQKLHIETARFPAQWKLYGKGAGPKRNQQMIDEGRPDYAVAFHPDITNSKGTLDMTRRLGKAGIPWQIFTGERNGKE